MCKSWCELIIAVVILVFSIWNSWQYSQWVVIVAAVVLALHSFMCKTCFAGHGAKQRRR